MKARVVFIATIATVFLSSLLFAAELSVQQAESYATAWFAAREGKISGCDRENLSIRTIRGEKGRVLFHVVGVPSKGFVVIAGDTAFRPVVAFSKSDEFAWSAGSPLYDLLVADMSRRLAVADVSMAKSVDQQSCDRIKKSPYAATDVGTDAIQDIRVAPMVAVKWTQDDFGGEKAFNLYTPNNYPCGCVATAFMTVMRYWGEPKGDVRSADITCWVNGTRTVLRMFGGKYDWALMPLLSEDCTMDAQRRALGKLAYDVSVAFHTDFRYGASSTWGELAAAALTQNFRYASARVYDNTQETLVRNNISASKTYRNAILASLDAGMPVVIGVSGGYIASHQFVIDGYGYDSAGVLFCHLNCGWGGHLDLWYNLMADNIMEDYLFSAVDEIVYNIHPYVSGDVISGRVMDDTRTPVSGIAVKLSRNGAIVAETVTNDRGIYAVRFSGKGTFVLSANDSALGSATRSVVIASEGKDVDYELDEMYHCLYINSDRYGNILAGEIANRWGEDLMLSNNELDPGDDEAPFGAEAAATFDGCVLSGTEVRGTIQVKAAKAKNGESKLTASVVLIDKPKKLSFKGVMRTDTGFATLSCAGERDISLRLGKTLLSGEMANGYAVTGARNLFASKDKNEAKDAEAILTPLLGAINVVADDVMLSINIGNKGKTKVSGTYHGVKVSETVQGYLGSDGRINISVVSTKKVQLAFSLAVGNGGISILGLDGNVKAGRAGVLKAESAFRLQVGAFASIPGIHAELLPTNEPIVGKWGTAKAAKVAYKNGELTITPATNGGSVENPSGLKLSCKEKDGSFTGSFKVYAVNGGKLKKYSATVTGLLLDGVGYGTALIKNESRCPVLISRE